LRKLGSTPFGPSILWCGRCRSAVVGPVPHRQQMNNRPDEATMSITPRAIRSAPGYLLDGGEVCCCTKGEPDDQIERMRAEVAAGLSKDQKELPTKYIYDARGSHLFEEITRLAVYYPTRAERALLETKASEVARLCRPRTLIELGA